MATWFRIMSWVAVSYVLVGGAPLFPYTFSHAMPDGYWYEYEGSGISLIGVIDEVTRYGPPNYGENPETDQKLTYYYLKLETPINVRGNPDSSLNRDTLTGVKLIQLVTLPHENLKGIELKQYLGRRVEICGKLFQAHSGRHFTPVVMDVEAVGLPESTGGVEGKGSGPK